MTNHLSPSEFVEAVERTLDASRLAHLGACETCRREVADLAALMQDVQATVVAPEPSPLFWDHFSRRVQAATAHEPVVAPTLWDRVSSWSWTPIATAAAVIAVAVLAVVIRLPNGGAPVPSELTGISATVPGEVDEIGLGDPAPDEALALVTDLASDLSWDEMQEIAQPSRDLTAAALGQLTAAQRAELALLVKAAMGGAE